MLDKYSILKVLLPKKSATRSAGAATAMACRFWAISRALKRKFDIGPAHGVVKETFLFPNIHGVRPLCNDAQKKARLLTEPGFEKCVG